METMFIWELKTEIYKTTSCFEKVCFHLPPSGKQQPVPGHRCSSHAPAAARRKRSLSEKQRGFVWVRHLSFKGQGTGAPVLAKLTDQFCLTPELWILITTFRKFRGVKPSLNKARSAIQWKAEVEETRQGSSCAGLSPALPGCRAPSAAVPQAAFASAPEQGLTRESLLPEERVTAQRHPTSGQTHL